MSSVDALVGAGVLVALLTAFVKAAYSVLQKRLTDEYSPLEIGWFTATLGGLILLPFALWRWLSFTEPVSLTLVGVLFLAGIFEFGGMYLFILALDASDLSLVAPLRQLTPVFVVSLEPLLLASGGGANVFLGGLCAVGGAYIVAADEDRLTDPLANLRYRGPQFALLAALSYAGATLAAKYALDTIPSIIYAEYLYIVLSISFLALLLVRTGSVPTGALSRPRPVSLGLVTALVSVGVFTTFSLISASQATIIFRFSLFLQVILGVVLFDEDALGQRLLGAACILVGVYLVV